MVALPSSFFSVSVRGMDTLLPSEEHYSITQSAKPIYMSHFHLDGGWRCFCSNDAVSLFLSYFRFVCVAILQKSDAAVISFSFALFTVHRSCDIYFSGSIWTLFFFFYIYKLFSLIISFYYVSRRIEKKQWKKEGRKNENGFLLLLDTELVDQHFSPLRIFHIFLLFRLFTWKVANWLSDWTLFSIVRKCLNDMHPQITSASVYMNNSIPYKIGWKCLNKKWKPLRMKKSKKKKKNRRRRDWRWMDGWNGKWKSHSNGFD